MTNILLQESRIVSRVISDSAVDERYRALLVGVFAVTALLIAAVGVFGVAARAVAQRDREMAIRVALGAEESGLVALILRGSLASALGGICAGLALSWFGGRVISG